MATVSYHSLCSDNSSGTKKPGATDHKVRPSIVPDKFQPIWENILKNVNNQDLSKIWASS